MAIPDFKSRAVVKFLPIPGEDLKRIAEINEENGEDVLGNLILWITTNTDPERRRYIRLILRDGTMLDHVEAEGLSRTDEFAAWKAGK